MQNVAIILAIEKLGLTLQEKRQKLVIAESCTGGGLAYFITEVPDCSKWFDQAVVTYTNQAKMDYLQVQAKTLEKFGAVSEQVAHEMAVGILKNSHADLAISTTGLAGPGNGGEDKPIGTVWFAIADHARVKTAMQEFRGDRASIKKQAILFAVNLLLDHLHQQ